MLRSRNELTFAIEQSARPSGPGVEVWSSLGAQSFIAIRYREEPPELNLGKLPAPLLEIQRVPGATGLAVLRPERPSPRTLEAAALVVANLCKRVAPERVTVHVLDRSTRRAIHSSSSARPRSSLTARLRGRSPLAFSRSRGATVLHPTSGRGPGRG